MMRPLVVCLAVVTTASAGPREDVLQTVSRLRLEQKADSAAVILRTWVSANNRDGDAHMLLGQVLAESGRLDEALEVWKSLVTDNVVDVARYNSIATRLSSLGHIDEARQLLRDGAARLQGSDPFAWQRAELALMAADWPDAVAAHRMVLRQDPRRRSLIEQRLQVLAGSSLDHAVHYRQELARALVDVDETERTPLTTILASVALATGAPRIGLAALLQRSEQDAAAAQQLYVFATECGGTDPVVAATAFGEFARRAPQSTLVERALLQQAEMLALSGRVPDAIDHYRQLAETSRTYTVEAQLRVARLLLDSDPAAALETLNDIGPRLTRGERWRRGILLRAEGRLRLDDLAGAAAEWTRLLDDEEARAHGEFGLAQIAFIEGRFDATTALIDSLVARQPTHPVANDALEMLLLIDEHGTEARQVLIALARARLRNRQGRDDDERADRQWLQTNAPAALRHLSWLDEAADSETSDPSRALELYRRIAADSPSERAGVSAAIGQARLLESSGQMEEALRAYETSVLTAPTDPRTPDIRRHIARLRATIEGTG